MLTALGRENEIGIHVRGALRNGLSPAEIGEILIHTGIYAGIPAANAAFAVADGVIAGEPSSPSGQRRWRATARAVAPARLDRPLGLGQQQLHVADPTLGEATLAVGEIQGPEPLEGLVVAERRELVGVGGEVLLASAGGSRRSWR